MKQSYRNFVMGVLVGIIVVSVSGGVMLLSRQPSEPVAKESDDRPSHEEQAPVDVPFATADDHIRGSLDALVYIIEYSDLECPYCKQNHQTLQALKDEYGDKVAWVFRHFPLPSLHPKALAEAEAAECVGELGGNDAFWKFVDNVFEVTPGNNGLDFALVPDLAKEAGVLADEFQECWDSGRHRSTVEEHYTQAASAGADGTPYNVIIFQEGDVRVPLPGAYPKETFKDVIERMLEGESL